MSTFCHITTWDVNKQCGEVSQETSHKLTWLSQLQTKRKGQDCKAQKHSGRELCCAKLHAKVSQVQTPMFIKRWTRRFWETNLNISCSQYTSTQIQPDKNRFIGTQYLNAATVNTLSSSAKFWDPKEFDYCLQSRTLLKLCSGTNLADTNIALGGGIIFRDPTYRVWKLMNKTILQGKLNRFYTLFCIRQR